MTSAAPLVPLVPLGHDQTLLELRSLWANGAGPRTLLFAGPDSVGRRHTARWLAAYVNCTAEADAPCLECESCLLLQAGAHPDLKEVLPALTTSSGRAKRDLEIRIDQLVPRERGEPEPLGPWLLTRPRFSVRVGVIDHAEAMNVAAANSLLKLLEEPPAWALIVLVASGPEAVLPTVASRSVTVRFRPVPATELASLGLTNLDHPATLLGQPGRLLARPESAPEQDEARGAAYGLLAALSGGLSATLEAADELATAINAYSGSEQGTGPLAWLRHALREVEATRYAAALAAVDACEAALISYAQVQLASTVLALQLRRIMR